MTDHNCEKVPVDAEKDELVRLIAESDSPFSFAERAYFAKRGVSMSAKEVATRMRKLAGVCISNVRTELIA